MADADPVAEVSVSAMQLPSTYNTVSAGQVNWIVGGVSSSRRMICWNVLVKPQLSVAV